MSKERRHIKYRRLVEAGCSKEQIKALMQPGAPTLWHADENGQYYPLDGGRDLHQCWFTKMLRKATWK